MAEATSPVHDSPLSREAESAPRDEAPHRDGAPAAEAPWHRRHRRSLIAALGGATAALATPPTDVFPAMFVGLGLLAWALHDAAEAERSPWRGMGLGLLWGTAGQLVGMRFVPSVITLFTDLGLAVALLAHLLLSLAQSLHWALGMGLALFVRRRLAAPLPLAFAAGIMLALSLPSIFLWSPAGLLTPWPALVQGASLIGERGVSAVMAAASAFGAMAFIAVRRDGYRRSFRWAALGAVSLVGGLALHGAIVLAQSEAPEAARVRIALIHAGVDPRARWDRGNWPTILSILKRETATAEAAGVDLSIWPEAAYPYPMRHDTPAAPRGARQILGGAVDGPILFGFIAQERPVRGEDGGWVANSYNAATIVEPSGKLQPSYDKIELLWFGETIPLGQHLPWLRRIFQRSGGLIPGREIRGLTLDRGDEESLRMGVLNCYEDTLPGLGRRVFAAVSPNLLVNVTNDAWFVGTEEPELHARLAAMRSIELRRDMVRAVNLGVSGHIDAWGRPTHTRDDPTPGYLLVEPTLRDDPPTLYARFGDAPAWLALALGAAASAWRRARKRPA